MPEGLVAFFDGIAAISSEILERRVIESQELAALAGAILAIQQRRHQIVDGRAGHDPKRAPRGASMVSRGAMS